MSDEGTIDIMELNQDQQLAITARLRNIDERPETVTAKLGEFADQLRDIVFQVAPRVTYPKESMPPVSQFDRETYLTDMRAILNACRRNEPTHCDTCNEILSSESIANRFNHAAADNKQN